MVKATDLEGEFNITVTVKMARYTRPSKLEVDQGRTMEKLRVLLGEDADIKFRATRRKKDKT